LVSWYKDKEESITNDPLDIFTVQSRKSSDLNLYTKLINTSKESQSKRILNNL